MRIQAALVPTNHLDRLLNLLNLYTRTIKPQQISLHLTLCINSGFAMAPYQILTDNFNNKETIQLDCEKNLCQNARSTHILNIAYFVQMD